MTDEDIAQLVATGTGVPVNTVRDIIRRVDTLRAAKPKPEVTVIGVTRRPYPVVTKHALERWQEHHPATGADAVANSFHFATEIDRGVAAAVTNQARRSRGPNRFYVTSDRRGMFVAIMNTGAKRPVLVTYLRLTEKHVEWFLEHYPIAGAAATTH